MLQLVDATHHHAAQDPALQGTLFVLREIHPGGRTEDGKNPGVNLAGGGLRFPGLFCLRPGDVRVPREFGQFARNRFRREDEIHAAGCHGASGHPGELRCV